MSEWRDALDTLRKQFDHENAQPLYALIETRMGELEAAERLIGRLIEHWGITLATAKQFQLLHSFPSEQWDALLAPDILPDYGEWEIWNAVHDLLRSIADTADIQEATMPKTKEELEIWLADGPEIDEIIAHILPLQEDANKLQCLDEAGIDNVEAYSIGMQLYYERYEPDND